MSTFKIATWNVNSLRVRLPHVLTWLKMANPDALAIQETKLPDADFPHAEIEAAGYSVVFSGQKTYNGVAILSKQKATEIVTDFPEVQDHQRRILGATIANIRVINLYVPNGESVGSEKYHYKLTWLKQLDQHLKQELKQHQRIIVLGDFNIAPAAIDVHDPVLWEGKVLFSEQERKVLHDLMQLGFSDCFRQLNPTEQSYSWWDYRMNALRRNLGLRIDHIFANIGFATHCTHCYIDKGPRLWERPSDHTPVVAQFSQG